MTTAVADVLTNLRLKLHRNNYRPVPVLGANVQMKSAGKRPVMKNWQAVCAAADETEVMRWTNAQRNCTNTGLLCGTLIGIDIDVLDARKASYLTDLACEMLGETTAKRIGRAPKILLAFRTDEPFDKIQTSEFHMLDGQVARVEALARGQQFVGFGMHPETKEPYEWPEASPLNSPLSSLPKISQGNCSAFIKAAEAYLRKMGGQTKVELRDIEQVGRKIAGLNRLERPSFELIEEALSYIPNNDISYDAWIRVGLALYAALGDEGRVLWEKWSAEASKNDVKYTSGKWGGFSTVRNITVGTLFWLAQANGWRAQISRGGKALSSQSETDGVKLEENGRSTVRIHAGLLHETVNKAEDALIAADLGYYQRGSMVVRPIKLPVSVSNGRVVEVPRLVEVKVHHVAEAFTRAAYWERYDKRAKEWQRTDCPHRVAETFLARGGQWRLPLLTGIVASPTLRPDGSILDQPGYDPQTGLLFDPDGCRFPLIPRSPDRGTAMRALGVLKDLISTFPFVTEADRSVALSAILTAMIRRSLSTAPLHGFSSPTAGSGKSLLVDIASSIATSRPAPVVAQGKTQEEMEKRLGASLIAGDPIIAIDNCEEPLGGELFCQIMTQTSLKIRILGRSVNAEVPSNSAIFATGNNLRFEGDMIRRALRATLDPGVERPELRAFESNPINMVNQARGEYVTAGLTILRAFQLAGRPNQRIPLGSFEDWSSWVRDALIWLGEADPCDTMEEMRSADPKLESLTVLLEQWNAVVGESPISVRELIEVANEQVPQKFAKTEFVSPELREVLLMIAGDRSEINSRRLGKWIGGQQGRIVGGRKIITATVSAGNKRWRIQRV